MNVAFHGEIAAQDLLAEQSGSVGLIQRFLQHVKLLHELAAHVNIGHRGSSGIAGDQNAFEQLMRVLFDQNAIVESRWFGLVRVDTQISDLAVFG